MRRVGVFALLLALVSGGCVDLTEIRQFAELSGNAGRDFPRLVRDLYESCMSQQRYTAAQRSDFRFDRFADLNDDANPILEEGRRVCSAYKDEQPALVSANAVLLNYMRTLGDLAADRLTNYDKSVDDLGAAIASAKLLSATEASAVTKLAQVLTSAVADGYRRRQLRQVLTAHDADIQALTAALGRIVQRNYIQQIENERVAMRDYYRKLAVQSMEFSSLLAKSAGGGADVVNPAPLDDLRAKYEERNGAMNNKADGARAYAKLLTTVGAGHHALSEQADKLSSKDVLAAALGYAKTIYGLAGDFSKVFSETWPH
jgi:hypothetical protein